MEVLLDFFEKLFSTRDYPPRWQCGNWSDFEGWLYIGSNVAIWGAYFAIPLLMFYFVRQRRELPFRGIFFLFIAFILTCGFTHLLDAVIFWVPMYRFSGLALLGTAVVSWATVVGLGRALPRAMEFRSPAELERIIREQTAALEEANAQLRFREAQFRALVEHHPDVICQVTPDLKIEFANQAIRTLAAANPEHYDGKHYGDLDIPAQVLDCYTDHVRQALDTQVPQHFEWHVPEPRQSFAVTLVPFQQTAQPRVMAITRDVSAQQQTLEQLRETVAHLQTLSDQLADQNKQLENFANIISHNLRSPVGNLNALINLYAEEETPEGQAFIIEKFRQVANVLHQTVADLSEVIRVRRDISKQRIHLHLATELERVIASLQGDIMRTGAKVTHDFDVLTSVHYPRAYLESILLNLLTNALKYHDPRRTPEVHFWTDRHEGSLRLHCRDNGLGMDLERHGHKLFGLYKTFHRNEDARGVGLFLTKNQVESLGGRIFVRSEPGVGTTFTIVFNTSHIHDEN